MRRTLALTMRALHARGHAVLMPDLGGQNDSLLPTRQAVLTLWRGELAQLAQILPQPFIVASWRGSTLIDDAAANAAGWWRMAPTTGASIIRGLIRTRIASERESGQSISTSDLRRCAAEDGVLELAGNHLSLAMLDQLDAATPAEVAPLRHVSPGREIPGSALWLRAEPDEDVVMAEAMAADISRWCDELELTGSTAILPAIPASCGSRRFIDFPVAGDRCAATIDEAGGAHGVLILSGGNEVRVGAHRGMAALAAHLSTLGHPVMRFDRRGVGDSEGANRGFEGSAEDIAAAIQCFRRECPGTTRITAFGNCDAASALLLHRADVDALVIANPWTIEPAKDGEEAAGDGEARALPPSAVIRARYAERLKSPAQWGRLFSGGVNLRKLWSGLQAASHTDTPSALSSRIGSALAQCTVPVTILLARRDATARAFLAAWHGPAFQMAREHAHILTFDTASHGFADDAARSWLWDQILNALSEPYDTGRN